MNGPMPNDRPDPRGRQRADNHRAPPDAQRAPDAADRVTVLAHELNNLLDGSLRCLGLARESLAKAFSAKESGNLDNARRQVETVYTAMERMCEVIHASMVGWTAAAIGPAGRGQELTLPSAIRHAVEVVGPGAFESGVRISVELEDSLEGIPARAVYPAVLNGLRNAVESVARTRQSGGVRVLGRVEGGDGAGVVVIEIHDDGAGLPEGVPPEELFRGGVSSKTGKMGVGLAISREILRELDGRIELVPVGEPAGGGRGGACLRLSFPVPRAVAREGSD
jgi:nitrogen fixation/metabolism regulation signal transduction histidine kinase